MRQWKLMEMRSQSGTPPPPPLYALHLLRWLFSTRVPWCLVSRLGCSPEPGLRSQAPIPVHAVSLPRECSPSPGFRGHNPSFDQEGKQPNSVHGKGSQHPSTPAARLGTLSSRIKNDISQWLHSSDRPHGLTCRFRLNHRLAQTPKQINTCFLMI